MDDTIALSVGGQGKCCKLPRIRGYQLRSGGSPVYVQEERSIPAGMGKYIHVQTNCGVTGDVLIEISNKTVSGLILHEIVYNVKKKLGCIFVENLNSKPLMLKRGPTIEIVTSCIVTKAEQGQPPEKRKEDTQSVTGWSNDTDSCIGGASVRNGEKAGWKVDSLYKIYSFTKP